jgi:hypothetical protein
MRCWRMLCIGVDGSNHIPRDMLCLDLEALLTRQRAVLPLMRLKNEMRRLGGTAEQRVEEQCTFVDVDHFPP